MIIKITIIRILSVLLYIKYKITKYNNNNNNNSKLCTKGHINYKNHNIFQMHISDIVFTIIKNIRSKKILKNVNSRNN